MSATVEQLRFELERIEKFRNMLDQREQRLRNQLREMTVTAYLGCVQIHPETDQFLQEPQIFAISPEIPARVHINNFFAPTGREIENRHSYSDWDDAPDEPEYPGSHWSGDFDCIFNFTSSEWYGGGAVVELRRPTNPQWWEPRFQIRVSEENESYRHSFSSGNCCYVMIAFRREERAREFLLQKKFLLEDA